MSSKSLRILVVGLVVPLLGGTVPLAQSDPPEQNCPFWYAVSQISVNQPVWFGEYVSYGGGGHSYHVYAEEVFWALDACTGNGSARYRHLDLGWQNDLNNIQDAAYSPCFSYYQGCPT